MNLTAQLANVSGSSNASQAPDTGAGMVPYYKEPEALKVSKLTLQVVLAFFGVLGNVLVCVVITKRANGKASSMNLYLRNLAIADLGVLLVNFPLVAVAEHYTESFPFGRFFCQYIAPATDIFFGASIWSITVIALERYKNIISRKVFVKKAESSRSVALKILLIWLVSFLVVAVPLYPIMLFDSLGCFPRWPEYADHLMLKAYVIGLTIFWYLLPLGIVTVTYVKISSRLAQSTKFHKSMHDEDSAKSKLLREEEKQRLKQNKKAQRLLTPLVVIFAVSMLPLNVFRLVHAFYFPFAYYEYYMELLSVCAFFVIINSAADPIVYYISSKEFRKGIEAMLCRNQPANESSRYTKTTRANSAGSNIAVLQTAQV